MESIESFIKQLKKTPTLDAVFNPWWQFDEHHDASPQSPVIRKKQLTHYLHARMGKARILLIGEALGYQGGHFSGMAMTSERLLLGHLKPVGVKPEHVMTERVQRTSLESVREKGFSEPTASVVWKFFIEHKIDPYQVVIWNAFPWHPYKKNIGYLSNRTPRPDEMKFGEPVLKKLIQMFDFETIIAVGEKSHQLLNEMSIANVKVRHPANGGVGLFRKQMQVLFNK